jgi:hypothetical protein
MVNRRAVTFSVEKERSLHVEPDEHTDELPSVALPGGCDQHMHDPGEHDERKAATP